jgi:hypothetical protein
MELKFQSKNKIGVIAALFLIILLSQHSTCNFLINAALGRLILVILILSVSSFSILLGIIAVLVVIILINENESVYLEGFEGGALEGNDNSDIVSNSSAAAMHHNIIGGNIKKGGLEGFNIHESERNITQGKSSKSIHVNKRGSSDNIKPYNIKSVN